MLGHPHLDADASILDAVVVEKVLAFPGAIRQSPQGRAHLRFGFVVQPVEADGDRLRTIAREHLVQAPGRHVIGGELGEDIPFPLAAPTQIGEHEVEGGPLGPRAREEPDRRYPQPLLVALGRPGNIAARDGAADICPVSEVDREGDQPALEEDGPYGLYVGQVIATHLGQVEEPDVAVAQRLGRNPLEEFLDREAHDPHVNGNIMTMTLISSAMA